MRGLELDYQRKPSNVTLYGVVICVLSVATLAFILFQYSKMDEESQILQIKLREFESSTMSRVDGASNRQDAYTLAREMKEANHVLKMLGLRWDGVFEAVAIAHGKGVALLALAPDPDKGTVRISAEAKNFSEMLDYVQQLEKQPALGGVHLQSHVLQKSDPQKPVRFVVMANWLDN